MFLPFNFIEEDRIEEKGKEQNKEEGKEDRLITAAQFGPIPVPSRTKALEHGGLAHGIIAQPKQIRIGTVMVELR